MGLPKISKSKNNYYNDDDDDNDNNNNNNDKWKVIDSCIASVEMDGKDEKEEDEESLEYAKLLLETHLERFKKLKRKQIMDYNDNVKSCSLFIHLIPFFFFHIFPYSLISS